MISAGIAGENEDKFIQPRMLLERTWEFLKNRTPDRLLYSFIFGAFLGTFLYIAAKTYAYLYMNWWGFYDYEFFEATFPLYLALWNYLGIWLLLTSGFWLIPLALLKSRITSRFREPAAKIALILLTGGAVYLSYSVPSLAVPLAAPVLAALVEYLWVTRRSFKALVVAIFSACSLLLASFAFQKNVVQGYEIGLQRTGFAHMFADIVLKESMPEDYKFYPSTENNKRSRHIQAKIVLVTSKFIYIANEKKTSNGIGHVVSTAVIPTDSVLLLHTNKRHDF